MAKRTGSRAIVIFISVFILAAVLGGSYLLTKIQHHTTDASKLPELSVELPANIPSDLKLTKAEKVPNDWSPYYRYTYSGSTREIVIVDQLSGWNFDPNNPCMYMTATKSKSGEVQINKNLQCTRIGSQTTASGSTAEIFTISTTGPVDNSQIVPDYYIQKMSDRFAIKATKGGVTEQEVKNMAADFDSYRFSNLQAALAKTQP